MRFHRRLVAGYKRGENSRLQEYIEIFPFPAVQFSLARLSIDHLTHIYILTRLGLLDFFVYTYLTINRSMKKTDKILRSATVFEQ